MTISIRLLNDNDHAAVAVAVLMEEMQAHYSVPCPSRETILSGLQNRPPGVELLIAEGGDSVFGFAAFSAIYPGPWLQPGIFLKDLFVSERKRGHGLGNALMKSLAVLAKERGLGRIDWTADPGNPRLLAFYNDMGGTRRHDKVFYRLDAEALTKLAT